MNEEQQKPSMAHLDPSIDEAFGALSQVEYPSIQEARFVNEFLPIFVGEAPAADISKWYAVCGHPYMPVNVFRGDEFIFRVPPMMRQAPKYLTDASRGHTIFEHFSTAEKKRAILPVLGEAHLHDFVLSRIEQDPVGVDIARAWNSIFAAYGKPLIPLPDESAERVSTTAGTELPTNADFTEEAWTDDFD
jgi:hypothetical protein